MSVSRSPAPSSIDLSGVPARVAEAVAQVVAVCREELRSEPRPEAPEEVELRVREATNEFARDVMGAVIENRDDGASRIERDGQSWFRVAVTPKTIMTSLGPVTYRRARYRSGASGASPVPVDESLGLVNDYLTRPAAELGLLMMGHCTAREAAAFFAKTGAMTPSVSTLQRLTLSMHECWESLGPETLGSIREAEGIPRDATTASVSLDGVMVPLRPGEDGRAKASWREAASGTVSFHDAEGKRPKTLYLGRMPESGKLTLKAQLASEVAHIRRARPRDRDRRYRRWRRRQLDLPGDPVARNRGDRLLACLRTSANRVRPCRGARLVREVPRDPPSRSPWRRQGDPGAAPPSRCRRCAGPGRDRAGTRLLPQASPSAQAWSRLPTRPW